MDKEREKKLLQRLRKCMALSASSEPHEAAAAMRQAQALMRELDLTEADLLGLGVEVVSRVVKTREGYSGKKSPDTLRQVVGLMQRAFGVDAIYEPNPGSANRVNVRYWGAVHKVMLAEYAHRVLWRSMMDAWAQLLTRRPDLIGKNGARRSFVYGYVAAVRAKVEALAMSDEETAAVARAQRIHYDGDLTDYADPAAVSISVRLRELGHQKGIEFDIHKPVGSYERALEFKP